MTSKWLITGAAALAIAGCGTDRPDAAATDAAYDPAQYALAVNDIARMDDREKDSGRKPAELLAFAQIDKGEAVGDYIMGGGYMTKLLAMAVGANGRVYAFQPDEFITLRPEYADEQAAAVAPYADDAGKQTRVFSLTGPISAPPFPEKLDTIVTVMNLHDLWLEEMPEGAAEKAIAALYDALKPGGTLVVVDHRGPEGSGAESARTLHRMDVAMARAALEKAGFVLEEESALYARPSDLHDTNVFDPSVRGKTDQFAWRLRKPG